MHLIRSIRLAAPSAALALAAFVSAPAMGEESAWDKAATEAAGPLAAELAKAFPEINEAGEGTGDFTTFVTALKAAGLGKPAAPQAPPAGGGEGGRPPASQFVAAEFFKQLDADGDGVLLLKELPPQMAEQFHDAEAAGDGKLTLQEFEPLVVAMRQRETAGGPGGRGGGRPNMGAADVEFAASLDADQDGKVTLADLRAAVEASLKKALEGKASLDTNQDGTISKKEYAISMPYKFGEIDELGMDGHARAHFKQEDHDGNGELSFDEVVRPVIARTTARVRAMQLAARLAAANADEDSTLTVKELQAKLGAPVAAGEAPWTALGLKADAVALDSLYGALVRLSEDDAKALDRLLP